MAYDEALAGRVRDLVSREPGLSEMKMFGGLAFLIGGNMAIAASGQGGLLVRVDPATTTQLLRDTAAEPFEMRGKQMPGWLRVGDEHVRTDEQLAGWTERGTAYARALPPKR